jgi:hypothetical protein
MANKEIRSDLSPVAEDIIIETAKNLTVKLERDVRSPISGGEELKKANNRAIHRANVIKIILSLLRIKKG